MREQEKELLAILAAGPIAAQQWGFMSARQRAAAQDGIDAFIAALDALDPDPDLEPSFGYLPNGGVLDECEPDDDEPTLGAPEVEYNCRGLPERHGHIDQRRWIDGEMAEDGELEPTLGSPLVSLGETIWPGQLAWSAGYQRPIEHDECEDVSEDEGACIQSHPHDAEPDEPELGCPDGLVDQRLWGGNNSICVGASEPSLGAPENPHNHLRWWQGKGSVELDHDEQAVLEVSTYTGRQALERTRRETKELLRHKGLLPQRSGHVMLIDPRWAHLPRCS